MAVDGQTAYWPSPAKQFHECTLGGSAVIMPCDMRREFFDNLTPSQGDKVVGSTCAQWGEVRFDYPDQRDGFENSRYLAVNVTDRRRPWSKGVQARSAYVDAQPSPIGVAPSGEVYLHERGRSAAGQPMSWMLESGEQYADTAKRCLQLDDFEPDFAAGSTSMTVTVITREYPRSQPEAWDPVMVPADATVVDFRAEGRLIRVRFQGNSLPAWVRFGRPSFGVTEMGER
jgi:hypothetical protein